MKLSTRFYSAGQERCHWDHPVSAPAMRRSFTLDGLPDSAALTVCGLGFYELYVNGKHVTRGRLSPYITNPDRLLVYDAYDLLPYLTVGKNTLAFLLGNGMQNCFGGYVWDFHDARFTSAPKLAFALELTRNGETLRMEADESLRTHPSPITFDDLRMGEKYDARLELGDWTHPDYDDSAWSRAVAATSHAGDTVLSDFPPILPVREIKPVSITREADGGYLYDFGENCAGLTRLSITAEAGTRIVIDHGERLVDGAFNQDNILFLRPQYADYPKYTQRTEYVCRGEGREEYTPHFTYYGFRYAKVWGITEEQATADLLTYVVMNTDLRARGGFTCSNEDLNRLQQMTRRSTLANFYHFPTDCPHREKNGWTADAALSAEQTLLNLDPEDNYTFWIRAICRAQDQRGALPGIVPTGGWGFDWGNGPAWDSVLIYLPYFNYRLRGDLRAAREAAGAILRYFHYLGTRLDQDGLLDIGLGDWCAPGDTASRKYTDSVITVDLASCATVLYRALNMQEEAAYTAAFGQKLRERVRIHLCDGRTMTFDDGSQTAQAMAIYYGICDSREEEDRAFSRLLAAIREKEEHLSTGVLGGRVILRVLADRGEVDLAMRMVLRPDPPSYGYMIAAGYDTLLENIHKDTDSCNHHFWGDISAFMIEYLAGIRPDPHLGGVNTVAIAPVFPACLSYAEGYHEMPSGRVTSAWRREGEDILLTLSLPAEIIGNVLLPAGYVFADGGGVRPAVSGSYRICRRGV